MKEFQVPQFITVEDKVIGPFTIKQFAYVGGGALLVVLAHAVFSSLFFYPIAIFIGALASSLAFLKVNQRPFTVLVKNAVFYLLRPRLYVWKKEAPAQRRPEETKKPGGVVKTIPQISASKLSDLAWSLDIKEKLRG